MTAPAYPVEVMIAVVASFHRVDRAALLGRKGGEAIQWPRHELAYVMRNVGRMSLRQIGVAMGGRDEKTVSNSLTRVESRRVADGDYDRSVYDLLSAVVTVPKAVAVSAPLELLGCIRALLQSSDLTDSEARRASLAILPPSPPAEGAVQHKDI